MRPKYTTIKDIAKALDISVATVSRALRDTHDVSPETRDKVLAVAAALNYKPNFNATGLVHQSTHHLGVLIPTITNYYFSTVITGMQEVAHQHGFNLVLYLTNDSPEREQRIVQNLVRTSLDGLLACVSSRAAEYNHFQELLDESMPLVFFDRVPDDTIKTSKVVQDDYEGAFKAVEHLIQSGYTKIAHITGPKGLQLTENRAQGYLDALRKYNLPVRSDWLIYSGFSQQEGEMDAEKLLESRDRPDAVFAVNDRKAVGAILVLKRKGIRVGKEIGVMGFTNDPISEIVSPTLSTVAEPAYELGRASCQLLLNQLKKNTFVQEQVVLRSQLVARASTQRI
ncbi:LacI family DNA-binding transcriptional regulator [Rhabdobacter roseus]|uniref:LacI family transcriptional regulator n=1 Tax=Rhabdobacter roseus TaxID=1655419 RepID=A0A840TXG7_9BACT|nr:LacI family DNA-binding transcriptional regulator [Rhabdobacter roseus]MBB5287625.1 LacI family transcriptional regulator [Rhabdobacter roseus]